VAETSAAREREVVLPLRAARRGDDAEVRRLDAGMAPLWTLFREHGSLRVI
jgi:4-hydroxy-tetrahydrodipicolinate synthase